ncbi:MAG: glucose-fructose oxidoreductase [Gammaproteobacteria bacterium]|nr:glucose-fructose oxidoreductase [Gammaproteobacteria bacterium]HJN95488.1 Gfo/Idh/MocA family oxidoreductase [Gammaproteobacteria bacterium]
MSKTWRIAGIDFEHFHMGDNLRMAFEHPNVEIVGICDESVEKMQQSIENFGISPDAVFTDYRACIEATRPDIVLLCPATGRHAEAVEEIAPFGTHIIMEKPFASSLAEADRMTAAMGEDQRLAINWPLAWYPPHITAKRLIDEGQIGEVLEVHFYDGNRGPLWHLADKVETTAEEVEAGKPHSWFYKAALGGGSLLDYLGYGTTLGTWYQGGRAPLEVTSMIHVPKGLEVDEHSITVARYAHGLSKFETRWGTFTDPWTHQPQPKCGFVIVGSEGTISNYDWDSTVRLQSREHPEGTDLAVDSIDAPFQNPIQYVVHCLENELPIEGPLAPDICRVGQQIVDTAFQSAQEGRSLSLIGA